MDNFVKLQAVLQDKINFKFDSLESLVLQYRKNYSKDKQGIMIIEAYAVACAENAKPWEIRDKLEVLTEYFLHRKAVGDADSF